MSDDVPVVGFQYMDGPWTEINFDKDKLEALNKKFIELGKAAKEAHKKMSFMGNFTHHESFGEQVASNLARCMSKIYGPSAVSMAYNESFATMMTSIVIRVQLATQTPMASPQWGVQFTDEFVLSLEKDSMHTVEQSVFLQLLPSLCKWFDNVYKLQFKLPMNNKLLWMDSGTPVAVDFNTTTSSYEYLDKTRFIEKILKYWYVNDTHSPVMKSWFSETSYSYIDESEFTSGPQYEMNQLGDSGRLMKNICPALATIVKYPCGCLDLMGLEPKKDTLEKVIIHLNDEVMHDDGMEDSLNKEWTREEIADWLESLDLDLTLRDNSVTTEKEN